MTPVLYSLLAVAVIQILCGLALMWMARKLEKLFPPDTTVWIKKTDPIVPEPVATDSKTASVPLPVQVIAHLMDETETVTEHTVKVRSMKWPMNIRFEGGEYIKTRNHPDGHIVYRRSGSF